MADIFTLDFMALLVGIIDLDYMSSMADFQFQISIPVRVCFRKVGIGNVDFIWRMADIIPLDFIIFLVGISAMVFILGLADIEEVDFILCLVGICLLGSMIILADPRESSA